MSAQVGRFIGRAIRRVGGARSLLIQARCLRKTRWQAKYIADFLHFYAGCADKVSGETLPIDKPDMFVFTKREPPWCVVAAVVPWNSQLFLVAVKLGPALAAGNTVVLKSV